ncbi:MAG: SpoIIE family protein phosphatase [Bacteroidota bacterium]|nr:SpoIIE family protein phosphatase [Bacteroidota bacterium]
MPPYSAIDQQTPGVVGTRLTRFFDARPGAVRALYLAALFPIAAYIVLHTVRFASIATDENVFVDSSKGVLITVIMPGGASDRAGLREGDAIIAINGRSVRNAREAMEFIVSGKEGNRLRYTVQRGERSLTVEVILADFGLPVSVLSFILTGAAFIVLSAFVILNRPHLSVARLFGWATLVTGFFLSILANYHELYYRDVFDRMHPLVLVGAFILAIGSMHHLCLLFPAHRFTGKIPRWVISLIYIIPFLFWSASRVVLPKGGWMPILIVVCTTVVLELVLRLKVRLPVNTDRKGVSLLTRAAGILAFVMTVLLVFVRPYSAWQGVLLWLIAIPLLFFASIVRYRLFDLYIILRPASVYHVLSVVWNIAVIVLFGWSVVHIASGGWPGPIVKITGSSFELVNPTAIPASERMEIEKRFAIGASIILAVILWKVRNGGMRFLDRKFYRGGYDYRRALNEFTKLSITHSDVFSLAREVVRSLPAIMHLRGAAFARRENGTFACIASEGLLIDAGHTPCWTAEEEWIRALDERRGPVAVDNLGVRSFFAGIGVELVTPVFIDRRLEAIVLLGEKLSGTNYTRMDIELLNNLEVNIADALVTMSFYEGEKERERMRRELEIARRIQLAAVPLELPDFPGIDAAAVSVPATEVGGDFYDFLGHHDAITFFVGDVSGKGMSAALYLSRIQGIIHAIDSYEPSAWELLVRLNGQLVGQIDRSVYMTLAALRLDLLKGTVSYLRAGHLPLLHYRAAGGEVVRHRPDGLGIGIDGSAFGEHLQQETFAMQSGDVFLLVSDGVTEAVNEHDEPFELDRLSVILRDGARSSASLLKETVLDAVVRHCGGKEPRDDMTILVVKLR